MNTHALMFFTGLRLSAPVARRAELTLLTRYLMRGLARYALFLRKGRPQEGLEAVGAEWLRMFPKPELIRLGALEEETLHVEVHIRCPLRGTGDVHACHRLMEYDRHLLRHIGGQLVVLRSQAEPGVDACELAIRLPAASIDDLCAAHEREGG